MLIRLGVEQIRSNDRIDHLKLRFGQIHEADLGRLDADTRRTLDILALFDEPIRSNDPAIIKIFAQELIPTAHRNIDILCQSGYVSRHKKHRMQVYQPIRSPIIRRLDIRSALRMNRAIAEYYELHGNRIVASKYLMYAGDPLRALKLLKKSMIGVEGEATQRETNELLQMAIRKFVRGGNTRQSLLGLDLVLSTQIELGSSPSDIANTQVLMAHILESLNIKEQALVYLKEAMSVYRRTEEYLSVIEIYTKIAHIFRSEEEYDQALENLQHVLEIASDHSVPDSYAKASATIAETLCEAERYEEALIWYSRLHEWYQQQSSPKKLIAVNMAMGSALSKLGRWDEAIRHYEYALQVSPEPSPRKTGTLLFSIGEILLEQKKYDEAAAKLGQALVTFVEMGNKQKEAETLSVIADAYHGLGFIDKVEDVLLKAANIYEEIPSNKDQVSTLVKLAEMLYEVTPENYDAAVRYLEHAADIVPNNSKAFRIWARLENEQGNLKQALGLVDRAIQIRETYVPAHHLKARILQEMAEYEEARRVFKNALAIQNDEIITLQQWALMERDLGNYSKAAQLLSQALKTDSNPSHIWQPWSLMELELGNYSTALDYAEHAVSAQPDSFYPYMARGEINKSLGKQHQSLEDLQIAKDLLLKEMKPQCFSSRLSNLLGRILILMEQYEEAETLLLECLGKSPKGLKHFTHSELARLYEAKGLIGDAEQHLIKALQISPHYLVAKNRLQRLRNTKVPLETNL